MKQLAWHRIPLENGERRDGKKRSAERRLLVQDWEAQGRLKYEADLDHNLGQDVADMPGGDALLSCIQCGTCSATCPVSVYMDYTPRKIIAMTRAGFKHDVLRCFTIWLCASCYSCTVDCPRQIKITDLMYTLKRKAIDEQVYPPRFTVPVLASQFFRLIASRGRSHEGRLMLNVMMRTNPFGLLKFAGLGWQLLRRGRLDTDLTQDRSAAHAGRDVRALLAVLERRARHAPPATPRREEAVTS
jgi:quinone-modifying oxidoreductase, subunit QmoC